MGENSRHVRDRQTDGGPKPKRIISAVVKPCLQGAEPGKPVRQADKLPGFGNAKDPVQPQTCPNRDNAKQRH
jgi:hypothetical protein